MKINRVGQATPFNPATFRQVRDAFENERHRLIFCLAWYTAERWGAVLQLRVEHCYLDPQLRQVREQILFPWHTRKDRATRQVPVAPGLARELKSFQPPAYGLLFPSPVDPEQPISLRAADEALRKALQRVDMHRQGYSTHSTRRGAITTLAERGLSVRVIQSLTGHRSLSSLGRYIEVSEKQRQSAVGML